MGTYIYGSALRCPFVKKSAASSSESLDKHYTFILAQARERFSIDQSWIGHECCTELMFDLKIGWAIFGCLVRLGYFDSKFQQSWITEHKQNTLIDQTDIHHLLHISPFQLLLFYFKRYPWGDFKSTLCTRIPVVDNKINLGQNLCTLMNIQFNRTEQTSSALSLQHMHIYS